MEKGVTKEEAKKNAPAKNVDEYIASAQKKHQEALKNIRRKDCFHILLC